MAKIRDLILAGKLDGVADVKNLTDRTSGLRLQIDCKTGVDPQALLSELYRLTPLEETFAINMVALVDGVPTTMGIAEICQHYIDHRLDVVVRRTQFRLEAARTREHLVLGLLIALDNIDKVIAIIRGSADAAKARERLMAELDLTSVQAEYILDMQLRRLTALEVDKLRAELDELQGRIADYEKILRSQQRQRTIVLAELAELVEKHGVPRRSSIIEAGELPTFEAVSRCDTARGR